MQHSEILGHLGIKIPNEGLCISPADAYLYTTFFRLLGATLDINRIPPDDLLHFCQTIQGMGAAMAGNSKADPALDEATERKFSGLLSAICKQLGINQSLTTQFISIDKNISISPFANESDAIQINGMTAENRTDRVSLFGSIDLTLDKIGLQQARQLNEIVSSVLTRLEQAERAGELPESISIEETVTVANPLLGDR